MFVERRGRIHEKRADLWDGIGAEVTQESRVQVRFRCAAREGLAFVDGGIYWQADPETGWTQSGVITAHELEQIKAGRFEEHEADVASCKLRHREIVERAVVAYENHIRAHEKPFGADDAPPFRVQHRTLAALDAHEMSGEFTADAPRHWVVLFRMEHGRDPKPIFEVDVQATLPSLHEVYVAEARAMSGAAPAGTGEIEQLRGEVAALRAALEAKKAK